MNGGDRVVQKNKKNVVHRNKWNRVVTDDKKNVVKRNKLMIW